MAIEKSNFSFSGREVWSSMHNCYVMPMNQLIKNTFPEGAGGDALFLTKLFAGNTLTSIAQAAYMPLEALIAEILFLAGKFWYYKFLLNPTNVSMSYSKLQTIDESSDLTIIDTYRNAAATMSFSGVSGCTLPRDWLRIFEDDGKLPMDTMLRYPKISAAWVKFGQLERFYKEINTDIVILFDMDLYVGKFTSFSYSRDAQNPWLINYDMQFTLYPGLMLHTLTPSDYGSFFDELYNRYGRTFVEKFEGKTSYDTRKN